MSLDWERPREKWPEHDFEGWVKIPSPFVRCDTQGCEKLANYMTHVRSVICFACETHMLELARK